MSSLIRRAAASLLALSLVAGVLVDDADIGDQVALARGRVFRPGVAGLDLLDPRSQHEVVVVEEGQSVKAGDVLLVLEAMKMQNEITADADGTVKAVNVEAGQNVKVKESLVILG